MSYRGGGITGSNNIPLGSRRKFGGDDEASASPVAAGLDLKRGRSPVRCKYNRTNLPSQTSILIHRAANEVDAAFDAAVDGAKRRKKKNRWGEASENKAAGLMGLTTNVQSGMTEEQLESYTLNLRVEEISQKLRINDVVPDEADR